MIESLKPQTWTLCTRTGPKPSWKWATTVLSVSQWQAKRKWIFEQVELQTCSVARQTYSSHARSGEWVSSDHQDRADLLPSWHLKDMLSTFLRALQPLLPGGSKENSHCGWFWGVCTLVSSTSFPALSLSPFYACYLTQDRIAPAWVLTQPGPHSNPFFFLNLNLFILIGG